MVSRTKENAGLFDASADIFFSKSKATTTDKVLNTPELLEAILLKLPPRDVLLAQRVSTFWRDNIQNSPSIQCHLFFKRPTVTTCDPSKIPVLNPFVVELLEKAEYEIKDVGTEELGRHYMPFCESECKHDVHIVLLMDDRAGLDFSPLKTGSWQSMLLSDRPVPFCFLGFFGPISHVCRYGEGATIGALVKELAEWQKKEVSEMREEQKIMDEEMMMWMDGAELEAELDASPVTELEI